MNRLLRILLTSSVVTLLLIPIAISLIVGNYLRLFLTSSRLSLTDIYHLVLQSRQDYPAFKNQPVNLLILGLDNRSDSLENTSLTDSIIVASYSPSQAAVTLIPLPRDLWDPQLKTKINALYYYGQKSGAGTSFVLSHISTLTGITIGHYLILDYQQLPTLIDLLGGVDVDVANSFSDPTFPNLEHIINPKAPPYITVSFSRGLTRMDGQTALHYVRSRTSTTQIEAGDAARSRRQLRLIQGLLVQLSHHQTLSDPSLLGNVYHFYKSTIVTNLTDSNLLALVWATFPARQITLLSKPLPENLLVNPPVSKYGQWVYEIQDAESFKTFFSDSLK